MDDFERELKVGFLEEASQLLVDVEQCFLSLETSPNDPATLDKIFRLAHNLKGSSKAVGFDALGAFTHEFETFLLKLKNGAVAVDSRSVSLLLKCNDRIRDCVDRLKADLGAVLENDDLIADLQGFESQAAGEVAAVQEAEPETAGNDSTEDFIQPHEVAALHAVASADQAALEKQAEPAPEEWDELAQQVQSNLEATVPPPVAAGPVSPSAPAKASSAGTPPQGAAPKGAATEESIRVSLSRLEKLLNYVGEMVILQAVLREQSYASNPELLRRTVQQLGKVTKEVQDLSMSLRMVQLKQTFQKMQRIVRDTSGLLGKKIHLTIEGDETEVDKTVLESLSDPLVHLIRNAVDHGIESPADRLAKGKSETGKVTLRAFHRSGRLGIEIIDDGGGIDGEKLKKKAIEKGIIRPNAVLSAKEAVHLIFAPGFSTKTEVSEVSGRGVGMDVVKTNIESLQGEIQIETEVGKGSVFRIFLPLTLAIVDGMVVRSGGERFVIPLAQVHESLKIRAEDLHRTTGVGEVLLLRGEPLPIYRLNQVLGQKASAQAEQIAIVVRLAEQPFAAVVDDIVGQQQIVIKKLGEELSQVRGFSGSAILGDGRPALILELADLVTPRRAAA